MMRLETNGFCGTTGRVCFVDGEALQAVLDEQCVKLKQGGKLQACMEAVRCDACRHWHTVNRH